MHADDAGARHIVALADRQHFGARHARRAGPGRERDGRHHDAERRADDADEGQRQQEARHGLEGVGDAHQHLVRQSAGEAGQGADDGADGERGGGGREPDHQRGAGAVEQFGQHVAAEPVGAERQRPILERRRQRRTGDGQRIAGKQKRGDKCHQGEGGEDERAGNRLGRTEKAGPAAHAWASHVRASLVPTRGSRKA